ncbi:MAG: ABC transporter permease [Bacteroidetes bacterium]|nr:ABC transporter permease [Bacteroidota bacterium]
MVTHRAQNRSTFFYFATFGAKEINLTQYVKESNEDWTIVIKPQSGLFDIDFKELIQYRDLLYIFVRRDLMAVYKQTILGPVWFFIQPLLTTLVYAFVYGGIANIGTDGKPRLLFYLTGTVLWAYFSECLVTTSSTFTANAAVFGKVYFPRVILPLAKVISTLFKMGIQMILLAIAYAVYIALGQYSFQVNGYILTLPLLIIIMANLGLGAGMIVTSMTIKYRDLQYLVAFGVQLLMFAAPVVYPLSRFHGKMLLLLKLNPVSAVIETFRAAVLGGVVDWPMLGYSFIVSTILLLIGFLIFNKAEKSFIDTV